MVNRQFHWNIGTQLVNVSFEFCGYLSGPYLNKMTCTPNFPDMWWNIKTYFWLLLWWSVNNVASKPQKMSSIFYKHQMTLRKKYSALRRCVCGELRSASDVLIGVLLERRWCSVWLRWLRHIFHCVIFVKFCWSALRIKPYLQWQNCFYSPDCLPSNPIQGTPYNEIYLLVTQM